MLEKRAKFLGTLEIKISKACLQRSDLYMTY